MARINGGQQVVRALEEEGVTHVFSISGGHISPIYEALLDSKIKLVTTRHEQAAAMMAGGWARVTGKTGVAIVTAGPGLTNAVTGIADAHMAGAPIVVISGAVATDMADRLDLQDLNQVDVVKPVTNWTRSVAAPERVKEMVHEAFKQARNGATGPAMLEIPANILGTSVEEEDVYPSLPIERPRPGLASQEVDKVIEMLLAAKQPILVAGSGVHWGGGAEHLVRFAEKSGVPVFTTGLGKGCIRDDHPMCYGPSLPIRPGAAMNGLTQADLIILMGTRISLFFAYGKILNPMAKLIHLNIDPREIGRNRVPHLGLVADAGRALEQLAEAAESELAANVYEPWRCALDSAHKSAMDFFQVQLEDAETPMHPLRLCNELQEFLEEDDILVTDGGDTQVWMNMLRKNTQPGGTLESGLFGCLGVGIPFAIAAAMAKPDKRVFIIIGDGSIGFNFMELQTALAECLNITVVVNNDNAWGMVKHSMILNYEGRFCGVDLPEVPYHAMLTALGGNGVEIDKIEQIKPALEEAVKRGGVNMINVHVRPNVISPGSIALAQIGKKGGGY